MASDDETSDMALPSSLAQAKIASLPSTAYYIPNFISEDEERFILDKVRWLAGLAPSASSFVPSALLITRR